VYSVHMKKLSNIFSLNATLLDLFGQQYISLSTFKNLILYCIFLRTGQVQGELDSESCV
jgi:hypothetical protein